MKMIFTLLLLMCLRLISLGQDLNFFAPAQPSGSVKVKLYAVGNVTVGQPKLVTTSIPFTRGSVLANDLTQIRVLKNGVEQAASITLLTPWRHITNATLDGRNARVVQVQFMHTFNVLYPGYDSVVVEWGLNARQLSRAWVNPSDNWHLVTSGSFEAADQVYEPDVIATLPKQYLSNGALRTRMDAFDNGVSDTIENAAAIKAINNWPYYTDIDHGMHNFFYTLLNEGTPISNTYRIPYKTDSEPWLYDRGATMYMLYLRSGNIKHLREAIRNTNFYKSRLHPNGIFSLKQPTPNFCTGGNDGMYSMNECLAYSYWFTGDTSLPRWINKIADIHDVCNEPYQWRPNLASWTERHTAFGLLANVVAYEIGGVTKYRNTVTNTVNAFISHQDGANGSITFPRIDGALYHTKGQHGEGAVESDYIASNWMLVLIADAMIRAYSQNEDPRIEQFIIRTGRFQQRTSRRRTTALLYDNATYLWSIDYLVNEDGTTNRFAGDEYNHSMEVAANIAWAAWFAKKNNQPSDSLVKMADSLYRTVSLGLDYYIRPGNVTSNAPLYRITPYRMYAWQYRPAGSFSWLMRTVKSGATLPVKVLTVSGRKVTGGNEINWTLENTGELAQLEIERSTDCVSFENIATFSGNEYREQYLDATGQDGRNCYRLKLTAKDGQVSYSSLVQLSVETQYQLGLYPNPAQGQVTLRGSLPEDMYRIRIYDMQGRVVLDEQRLLSPSTASTIGLPLPNGQYQLRITDKMEKVVKTHQLVVLKN